MERCNEGLGESGLSISDRSGSELESDLSSRSPFIISTKRDQNFRRFSSGVAHRYERRGKWSPLEISISEFLTEIGFEERETVWHNFKIHNPEQNGYYELDFCIPSLRLVIECDGGIWHTAMGGADLKDKVRDNWLKFLGYKTIRVKSVAELRSVFRNVS